MKEDSAIFLQGRLQPLDLWGSYEGVRLFLEWDSVEIADSTSKGQLQRSLIAASHSQNLSKARSNKFKVAQDILREIIYSLVEVRSVP